MVAILSLWKTFNLNSIAVCRFTFADSRFTIHVSRFTFAVDDLQLLVDQKVNSIANNNKRQHFTEIYRTNSRA